FIELSLLLALLPPLSALLLPVPEILAIIMAVFFGIAPYLVVRARSEKMRLKFQTQLPNAIDLMISVLKSGHSIPQAVRSVSEEIAEPCGQEFSEVFGRMNLGQSLPDALLSSVAKWDSFELDLVR